MARKLGWTLAEVVDTAAAIADDEGIEALRLAAVADRLGMRPPSLVHHVGSLEGLRRAVAIQGAKRLGETLASAASGLTGAPALLAVGRAYRAFARRHPGQLAAMLPAPRPGEDDELYAALGAPVAQLAGVLADLGLAGDDAIHFIRVLRSFLHGFADLERRGGFGMPQRVEASFERGLELLIAGAGASRGPRRGRPRRAARPGGRTPGPRSPARSR